MVHDSPKTDTTNPLKTYNPLSASTVDKLRSCCQSQRPTLRPSIQKVVRPLTIETAVLSAIVKHYGFASCVGKFELAKLDISKKVEFSELLDVADEAFFRIDALVRQLQAMAELEKKWSQDLVDIHEGNLQPTATFFNDYHLQEDKAKELELLCNLKGIVFDAFDHEKSVGRLIQILESESTAVAGCHYDIDMSSEFPRTSSYVKYIMERAELLLTVTIMENDSTRAFSRNTTGIANINRSSFILDIFSSFNYTS